jgi:Zn-dependent M28 family amino/carboxypeptidase
LVLATYWAGGLLYEKRAGFDGDRAYQDVVYQVSLGPRWPGSEAHSKTIQWILLELNAAGWRTETQDVNLVDQQLHNLIAQRGTRRPWIILGAHYDSRLWADLDPDPAKRKEPVPGANDAASGVAVLLELARVLPKDLRKQVWLVFFDAEDQGNIQGQDWILGSRAFVEQLSVIPDKVVIVDMIGDSNLKIYFEDTSNQELARQIWDQAAKAGFEAQFIKENKYQILDDHIPFVQRGIDASVIIDFDYPYWHTTSDTPDKVSAHSLRAVGETLLQWLGNA